MKKKKVFKPLATGWLPHKPDYQHANWNRIKGIGAPSPPAVFTRPILDDIPFQGSISCCVACTAIADQQYGSGLEGHKVTLSFREAYAETPGNSGGRNYVDVARYIKNTGVPEASFCPNDVAAGVNAFLNVSQFQTPAEVANAQIYRLKNYSFVNTDLNSLRAAAFNKPIWIAIPGNNADWSKPIDQVVTYSGKTEWYHSVLLWDWNNNLYNGTLNWWGDKYRMLSTSYPILAALSTEDLPDNWQQLNKNMEYVIIGTQQYLIYSNLKIAYSIGDEQELQKLRDLGLTGDPIGMTSLDGYTFYPMIQKERLRDLFNF